MKDICEGDDVGDVGADDGDYVMMHREPSRTRPSIYRGSLYWLYPQPHVLHNDIVDVSCCYV